MKNQFVHQLFEEQAIVNPDNIAIEEESRAVSYHNLNVNSNHLANSLRSTGVGKETVVGVILPSSVELITSLLAIFKAGGIYMPLDLSFGRRRLLEIFNTIGCQIVITNKELKNQVEQFLKEENIQVAKLLVLDENGFGEALATVQGNSENLIEEPVDSESSNYIFYTSGTTGGGKAILGSHKSLAHFITWETKEFKVDSSFRVSQLASITFDASLRDIFLPLCNGGTVCIPSANTKSNPALLIEWLSDKRISIVHCVPSLFRLLSKEISLAEMKKGEWFPDLKHLIMAGEALFAKDLHQWTKLVGDRVEIVNMYGTSETTLTKTFHRIKEIPESPFQIIHAGKPIDNTFIAIINGKELCRIGEIGEVYIKTKYSSKGYYNHEKQTKHAFVQNPLVEEEDIIYKTGDLGRYLKDRSIEILGRIDDQLKVNGIRVEPYEIEQAILGFKGISETIVLGQKRQEGFVELVCYYVSDNVEEDSLRNHLQKEIAQNIIPTYFIKLDELPLSINGKIDKKALPKPEKMLKKVFGYEAPIGELEEGIERIWKGILGLKEIGRKVSFFDIGGNSLKSLQVVSRIYKEYSVVVKMDAIFSYKTIEHLATHLNELKKKEYKPIIPLPEQEFYDLSHSQKRVWILDQVEEEKALYNVPGAYLFEGELNFAAFNSAIESLVERHEILRSTFELVGGEPKQKVHKNSKNGFNLLYVDLRKETDKEDQAVAIISEQSNSTFDLENGPLFKATLIHLEDNKYMFLYVMHHIISDAWSMEILTNEVFTLYDSYCKNLPNPLSSLKIHYKDFAEWQNRELDNNTISEQRTYWLDQFKEVAPVLQLPTDFARPAIRTYEGNTLSGDISKETKKALEHFCKKNEVTLFMVWTAIINLILYKYSNQRDIVIGTPVTGRDHPDLENQVGYFVNTLAIRTKFDNSNSFLNLLQEVKRNVVNGLKHQLFPFDKLVQELDLTIDRSRNPLFDVGFTYIKENALSLEKRNTSLSNINVSYIESGFDLVKADLWIKVLDMEEDYILNVSYNLSLFRPAFIQKVITDVKFLLEEILKNPGNTLTDLISLSVENQLQLNQQKQETIKTKNLASLKKMIKDFKYSEAL